MACQTMLAGMKFSIAGTQNPHGLCSMTQNANGTCPPEGLMTAECRKFLPDLQTFPIAVCDNAIICISIEEKSIFCRKSLQLLSYQYTMWQCYFVGSLAGVLNALVLITMWKRKRASRPLEFYVALLASMDFIQAVFIHPWAIASSYKHRWLFHHEGTWDN